MPARWLHLLRNSFRHSPRQHWKEAAKDLKPVYTAATEATTAVRFEEFAETWQQRYPAIVRLWCNAWAQFTPGHRTVPRPQGDDLVR